MPLPRFLILLTLVLFVAAVTVMIGAMVSPRLPAGAGSISGVVALAAVAVLLLARR